MIKDVTIAELKIKLLVR